MSLFNSSSNGLHCVHTTGGTAAPETTTEMTTIPGEKGTYLIVIPFSVQSLAIISLIILGFANANPLKVRRTVFAMLAYFLYPSPICRDAHFHEQCKQYLK